MQEERKMILKMIEDGKISAEEGLQLLNALKEDRTDKQGSSNNQTTDSSGEESSHTNETDKYVSRNVNWDADGFQRAEEKVNTFATRFTDFVEDAVQKIKEFDLDFNFGSSVEVQHIFQHREATVKDVDIHVENGSITFQPWEEDDVRVECNVKVYKVRDTDEARRVFLDEVVFDFKEEKLRLDVRKKSMKVNTVVYVPKQDLQKIKIYAFNGKITGENVDVNSLETQTVNGRIHFESITGDRVRLETVNGTIAVPKLESNQCDVKTVNGTVTINSTKGDLDAETLNGTIHYTLLQPNKARAYIKTTTGSVNVRVPNHIKTEGDLKTTVGGINCDLPQMTVIDEKKDFASKKMSFLSNKNEEPHFYIEAEATTGAISIKN